jgi:hypothetical protein
MDDGIAMVGLLLFILIVGHFAARSYRLLTERGGRGTARRSRSGNGRGWIAGTGGSWGGYGSDGYGGGYGGDVGGDWGGGGEGGCSG